MGRAGPRPQSPPQTLPPGYKPGAGGRRGQSRAGPLRGAIAQMAALATVAKKVWSARRLLVLLFTPLVLLPVVFALPPKVTPPLLGGPPIPPALGGRATVRTLSSRASEAEYRRGPSLDFTRPHLPTRCVPSLSLPCTAVNTIPLSQLRLLLGALGPTSLLDLVISAAMIPLYRALTVCLVMC